MDPTTPGMCWHITLWKYLIWCNRYNSLKFKLPEITMFKMTKANSHMAYKIRPLKVGLYSRWKNSFENRLRFDKIMAMCSVCSFLAHLVYAYFSCCVWIPTDLSFISNCCKNQVSSRNKTNIAARQPRYVDGRKTTKAQQWFSQTKPFILAVHTVLRRVACVVS